MPISKLTLNGQVQAPVTTEDPNHPDLILEKTILVAPPTRGEDNQVQIQMGEDNLVELIYEDNTTWLCTADALEELYPGQLKQQRGADEGIQLPLTLDAPPSERGLVQQIALKVAQLFTKKAAAVGMAELAKTLEEKHLGTMRGVFRVSSTFELSPFVATDSDSKSGPSLLFIHGTNSSSTGSFAELVGSDLWSYATNTYNKNNILAFQHETLTKSPLQNAAELIAQLPAGADLHVITHSRGGLVGEVLARFSGAAGVGFSEMEIAYLKKENRDDDVKYIRQLQDAYKQKQFKVSRFIRVACPTAGTTILSKRLDHFFNIGLNLIGATTGIAVNPIYIATKNLLVAAIDQKNDPKVLPGLEAMNPDSPFITVLNSQKIDDTEIDDTTPILVISGNCKAKVNFKALLILTERLFFAEKNDLVVNTQSMYEGSKRHSKLRFFFDEGTDVDHFSYFKNKKTNSAIKLALESPDQVMTNGFTEFSRGGSAARGALAGPGDYFKNAAMGKRPIVVLIPGIMGSCLTQNFVPIWVRYVQILQGDLFRLDLTKEDVKATAIVKASYERLGETLSADYDVVTFPYDWRLSPKDAAGQLETELKRLMDLNQPIKIVAHSLGGVVVRDLMVFYAETWKRLNATDNFRLLFLGSPLMGSFRIVNVLFGEDDIIKKLSKLDLLHTKRELLAMFARFPGILGLLPLTSDPNTDNFGIEGTWAQLANATDNKDWPIPKANAGLDQFNQYQQAVVKAMPGLDLKNAVYVAGRDKETPLGYRIDTRKDNQKELVFLSTAEGDASVTWDSGIPKSLIEKNAVYYVNHSHGDLANSPDMFSGIKEILERGKTTLFTNIRPLVRGDQRVFRKPQTADFDLSEDGVNKTLMGLSDEKPIESSQLPVRVSIAHGDLKYASYPVLAGHFKGDSILYAEKRIDQILNGQLEERNRLGIYPGDFGTCEIIFTPVEDEFQGAVIVGIGEQDGLTPFDLAKTIEQAASKYLVLVNAKNKSATERITGPIGLSPLVIGCGYGGLSIDSSIHAILQGITNANARISNLYGEKARLVEEIEFVELYQDRVLGCYYAIKKIASEMSGALNIIPAQDGIRERNGSRQKVNIDQGRDWWNRITIAKNDDEKAQGMRFSISTGAAREEMQNLYTAGGVVDRLLANISTDNGWSTDKAAALFELLMPNAFKARMKRHGNITWVLDDYTAGYPWELLQQRGEDVKPLCINAGMIRQLSTANARTNIETVTANTALVVGDPVTDGFLPQLDGALDEAKGVAQFLDAHGYKVTQLLRETEDNIIPALFGNDYKILHLAGHGVVGSTIWETGMVVGNDSFLSSARIAQIGASSDLAFVNCCYLGKVDEVAEKYYQDRYKLAANIGTQLINNGVKAVIVAGWKVDDAEAKRFADVFYQNMFIGRPFGEAVRLAREATYNSNPKINTWGAYQCYGNPWYRLKAEGRYQDVKQYVISEQAEIDLLNLDSDMRTGDHPAEELLTRLKTISDETDRANLRTPTVTEWEAMIYKSLGKYDLSLQKYQQLIHGMQGGYSFKAVELYCNLRAKLLKERIDKKEAAAQLEKEFDQLHSELEALILLSPTADRYDIMGSCWKRRTALYLDKDSKAKLIDAVQKSAQYYSAADKIADKVYPFCNWIALQNLLIAASIQQWGETADIPTLDDIHQRLARLEQVCAPGPGTKLFQDWIAPANLKLTNWFVVNTHNGADTADTLMDGVVDIYHDTWGRVGATEDRMSDIQHLQLLIDALAGLTAGQSAEHFMIGRMKALLERLKQYSV
ncbi:MAG: CHAT domain-containing protein [Bacteroidetes bacterium]|nr:CHAT domain-containing protein [Bacteroidota bacterium]